MTTAPALIAPAPQTLAVIAIHQNRLSAAPLHQIIPPLQSPPPPNPATAITSKIPQPLPKNLWTATSNSSLRTMLYSICPPQTIHPPPWSKSWGSSPLLQIRVATNQIHPKSASITTQKRVVKMTPTAVLVRLATKNGDTAVYYATSSCTNGPTIKPTSAYFSNMQRVLSLRTKS